MHEHNRLFSSFVVNVCHQRTGSKFFGACLKRGLDIVPLGEIFNPDGYEPLNFWIWLKGTTRLENPVISEETLDLFFYDLYRQFGLSCFDLMYNQTTAITPKYNNECEPFIINYFKKRGFAIVHTVRDPFDVNVSIKLLEVSNIPHENHSHNNINFDLNISLPDTLKFVTNYFKWVNLINSCIDGYFNAYSLEFNELVSNNGFLPDALKKFLSEYSKTLSNHLGDNIQLLPALSGRSTITASVTNLSDYNKAKSEYYSAFKMPCKI